MANYNLNESADKVRLTTKVKRGSGTRDQDTVKVDVRAETASEAADKLAQTLEALETHGVSQTLRDTQPENNE